MCISCLLLLLVVGDDEQVPYIKCVSRVLKTFSTETSSVIGEGRDWAPYENTYPCPKCWATSCSDTVFIKATRSNFVKRSIITSIYLSLHFVSSSLPITSVFTVVSKAPAGTVYTGLKFFLQPDSPVCPFCTMSNCGVAINWYVPPLLVPPEEMVYLIASWRSEKLAVVLPHLERVGRNYLHSSFRRSDKSSAFLNLDWDGLSCVITV